MKVLIALATFNRPIVTQFCLYSLSQLRSCDVRLVVYDDASTVYDERFLSTYADEVVRFESNGGITRSRAKAVRDFVYRFPDYDLLYMTDNDAFHDPIFVDSLNHVFTQQASLGINFPVSLFNTRFHNYPENVVGENDDFLFTKSIPGISHCYNREMAEKICDALNTSPSLEFKYGWDYSFIKVLDCPCLLSKVSLLEHFARDKFEGGMHAANSGLGEIGFADFERDRAINPTEFLIANRDLIIRTILK